MRRYESNLGVKLYPVVSQWRTSFERRLSGRPSYDRGDYSLTFGFFLTKDL